MNCGGGHVNYNQSTIIIRCMIVSDTIMNILSRLNMSKDKRKKRNYPSNMSVSKDTYKLFMKMKPDNVLIDDYLKYVLDHMQTCFIAKSNRSYR